MLKEKILSFIQKTEKYTGFDVRYFVENGFYLSMVHIISILAGLFLAYIFTHFSSKEIYGKYHYILSIFGLLGIFSLQGINTAIIQSVSRGYDKTLGLGTKVRLKYSLLGSLALILISLYYLFQGKTDLSTSLFIGVFFFPLYMGMDTYFSFLVGKKQFRTIFLYRSLIFSLPALLTGIVVYISKNIVFILITHLICITFLHTLFFYLVKRKISLDKERDFQAISYGKHLTLIDIFGVVESQIDKLLTGIFFGFANLAVFSIGKLFSGSIKRLWGILYELTFSKLATRSAENALITIKTKMKYVLGFFFIVCLLLFLICPSIIPLFFTKEYEKSILYAQLMIGVAIIGIPGAQFETYLRSQKKERALLIIRIGRPIVTFLALPLFIIWWGIIGIILARMLTNVFYSLLSWRLSVQNK